MRGAPVLGGDAVKPLNPADADLLRRHLDGGLQDAEPAVFLQRLQESAELRNALAEEAAWEALFYETVKEKRPRAAVPARGSWLPFAAAALMVVGLAALLFRETPRSAPEEKASTEPPIEIRASIEKGCRFIESRKDELVQTLADGKRHSAAPRRTYGELAALALLRGGTPRSHPLVEELIGRSLGRPLESTYAAALRAMLLAELGDADRLGALRSCAQFLVDSQCVNGQWDYGRAQTDIDPAAVGIVRAHRTGPMNGDNSATAWAVQGLLACERAGLRVDPEVLTRSRRWWLSCQNPDGGWGYAEYGVLDQSGAQNLELTSNASYGSATASGLASLAALRTLLGPESATDSALQRGLGWLGENFAVDRNPKKAAGFSHSHWLLAAERAGLLLGTHKFGSHDWYAAGSAFLLSRQGAGGEWALEGAFMKEEKYGIVDTCLAILFLARKG